MRELKEILIYILNNYPDKNEMSNARLTKLVYLSDWYHAIHNQSQISSINWYFDNYGPFVWDIFKVVESDEDFNVKLTSNYYGTEKKLISLNKSRSANLDSSESKSIDTIIEATKNLNWDRFIKLVYSTYPILTSDKYSSLNLVQDAFEFNKANR
jgi:hypothetical protein